MDKKILIIDDSDDDREIMKRFLEKAGYRNLLFASDGLEGAALARREKPDLVILDIVMPKKEGPEVADALRKDPVTRNIPVLFVTSLVRPGENQGGSTRVFSKPFDESGLLEKLKKVLELEAA